MKFRLASLALLGLPAALAAVAADHYQDAAPSRPEPALRIPRPSPLSTNSAANAGSVLLEEEWEAESASTGKNNQGDDDNNESFRVEIREAWPVATALTSTKSSAKSTAKSTASSSSSSSSMSAASASITQLAVFTAEGLAETVTSVRGSELVDGRVLTLSGAAQLIGGVNVAEVSGGILVDGSLIRFSTQSTTSTAAAASGSSSPKSQSSASAAQSSSSSGAAGPMVTGMAGVRGAVVAGAVVGAWVL